MNTHGAGDVTEKFRQRRATAGAIQIIAVVVSHPADLLLAHGQTLPVSGVDGLFGPETERAGPLIARRGTGPRTARYLAGRGFGEEAVEAALGGAFGQEE